MATYRQNRRRRGVILLVLLGMLALFGATAFAFVVIASHARQTSQSLQRVDRVMHSSRQDLEEAMRQALRDTKVKTSVLRTNSLLQDLYGDNSIGGWVINRFTVSPLGSGAGHPKGFTSSEAYLLPGTATDPASYVSPVADGQLIEFTAGYTIPGPGTAGGPPPPPGATGGLDLTGNPIATSTAPNTITIPEWFGSRLENYPAGSGPDNEPIEFQRRVGCVLTIIDPSSVLYNKSTRIVGYRPVSLYTGGNLQITYHRFQVLPFEGVGIREAFEYFATTESDGHDFRINGTPFSGEGTGYNPSSTNSYKNDEAYSGGAFTEPHALLPNPADPDSHATLDYQAANEDYDAPDYQNMLLAMEQWDGTGMTLTRSPSLHRPELANYWLHYLAREIYDYSSNDQALTWITILQPYGEDGVNGTGDEPIPALPGNLRDAVYDIKRRCLLRPLHEDHANFDGSNSNNWPVYTGDLSSYSAADLAAMARASWGAADLVPESTLPWSGIAGRETVPWDVDNDGDGIPDSIWVDIGLPLRTLANGRKIKPLVALHCIDLDGRLNLNTAGSNEQLLDRYTNQTSSNELLTDYFVRDGVVYAQNLTQGAGPTTTSIDLLRGQGCGPAEINLYQTFLRTAIDSWGLSGPLAHAAAMRVYRQLLLGGEDIGDFNGDFVPDIAAFEGRYGEMWLRQAVPPQSLTVVDRPAPGFTSSTGPAEILAASRMFGFPANYFEAIQNRNALAYGSPMDLKGTMVVGVDLFGQPIYSVLRASSGQSGWNTTVWENSSTDIPYELMLGSVYPQSVGVNTRSDNAFTIAEFEPILRKYDRDAADLPDRLRRLLEANADSPYRRVATTESWDLPVPNLAFPTELLDDWQAIAVDPSSSEDRPPQHIIDLIAARIRSFDLNGPGIPTGINVAYPSVLLGVLNTSTEAKEGARRIDFSRLLALDVLGGMRIDLNRPFGNGSDDDGNRVVDEPGERLALGLANRFEMFNSSTTTRFDHDNDGYEWQDHNTDGTIDGGDTPIALTEHQEASPNHDRIYSYRQAYARQLYVLMMALVEQDWYPVWDDVIAREMANSRPINDRMIYQARARAIAQWAINVVDFRDADSVMTPFKYDIYPFAARTANPVNPGRLINTWDADNDIGTIPDDCGLVWGCERPELLITETMATHDRRQYETSGGVPPWQYANLHRPEGSLFVELFNPSSPSEPVPGEFGYDSSTGTNVGGVRLNQTTTLGNSPVWRLAVYEPPTTALTDKIPNSELGFSDPHDPSGGNPPTLKRLAYFIESSDVLPEEAANLPAFRTSLPDLAPILPRRYAVVGPGDRRNAEYGPGPGAGITLLGELPASNVNNLRRIEIVPDPDPNVPEQVRVFADGQVDQVEQLRSNGAIQPPVGIVIDQVRAGPGDALRDLRLSISEPTLGYAADSNPPNFSWVDGYDNGATPQEPAEDLTRSHTNDWGAEDVLPADGFYDKWDSPLGGPGGTISALCYVHLQRLADPTRPYDADWNPYRTVDFAPVDLTVFDSRSNATNHNISSTTNKSFPTDGGGNKSLFTRQRGEGAGGGVDTDAFWQPELIYVPDTDPLPQAKNPVPLATGTPTTIDGSLGQSLGYLNEFYFEGSPLNAGNFAVNSAYTGAPGTESGTTFTPAPFPWLTWLNRPFANPMELLQVPAVRSSRLLLSYENNSTPAMSRPVTDHYYMAGFESFPHLASFFATKLAPRDIAPAEGKLRGVTSTTSPLFPPSGYDPGVPHFYRLFEYVQVPTRFVGSYIQGDADEMMGRQLFTFEDPVTGTTLTRTEPLHPFHPPFNAIHTYREPGKVNLNTVVEPQVLASLLNDHAQTNWNNFLNGEWTSLIDTRRAYDNSQGGAMAGYDHLNLFDWKRPPVGYTSTIFENLPTRAVNPFRSFAGVDLVPGVPAYPATVSSILHDTVQEGINATLMRARFNVTALPDEPLEDRAPLLPSTVTFDYMDATKNSFFKFQSLQRLSNLATTRSNVYALWITVGYFEAEPMSGYNPATQAHIYPDGYTFGRELGADTGDVTRHRAFYVIDRSIPVGFLPGEDLNTEKAVLLRRFIE